MSSEGESKIVWFIFILAIVIAVIASSATSQSKSPAFITLLPGPDVAERRADVIEFAAQHDWRGEFTAEGIELPPTTIDQIVAPLLDRTAAAGEGGLIIIPIDIKVRGFRAAMPEIEKIKAASSLVEARVQLEAYFTELKSGLDPKKLRVQLWKAYGSGFDAEVRTFLGEWQPERASPELVNLIETMRAKLDARLPAPVMESK